MTGPQRSIWFVIAAMDEGSVIGEVVDALTPHGSVVLVDDGSKDDTGEQANRAGAHVLRHLLNRGQGAALQTGIGYALRNGASHIVTFDADGQHRVEDALAMIAQMDAKGLDVVLGSRFTGAAIGMGWRKRLVLQAAVIFTRTTTGLVLTDTHNGLRVFSRAGAQTIDIRQDRMAHASEILSQIARKRLRYEEAPVTIVYSAYSVAKGQRLSNSVRILEDLMMGRLSR